MAQSTPTVSVIIPAYNAERFLPSCLDALEASDVAPDEVILVDDVSTDRTPQIARERGLRVLTMDRQRGPAGARNLAAREATGDILMFIDADVVVHADTIARVIEDFREAPGLGAVFGSYDDEPAEPNFLSQYKNLQHHYVHQRSNPDASTFWSGCGAVRRELYLELGGFDLEKYPEPSIEDIELGFRIRRAGYRILLDKQLQCKHLKLWTMRSHLRTEIFCRAIPWSKLILESSGLSQDLNLNNRDRYSAALVGAMLLMLPLALVHWGFLLPIPVFLAGIVALNRDFYGFFLRRRGWLFVLRAIPMHLLYFLYSATVFAGCWVQYRLRPAH